MDRSDSRFSIVEFNLVTDVFVFNVRLLLTVDVLLAGMIVVGGCEEDRVVGVVGVADIVGVVGIVFVADVVGVVGIVVVADVDGVVGIVVVADIVGVAGGVTTLEELWLYCIKEIQDLLKLD